MADVDVTTIARERDVSLSGTVDPTYMRRAVIIAGGALAILVAIRIGLFNKILP